MVNNAVITEETGREIVRRLDIILAKLGWGDDRPLAPVEAESVATGIVLQFRKRKEAKNDRKARN
jgi:hypothetical protein